MLLLVLCSVQRAFPDPSPALWQAWVDLYVDPSGIMACWTGFYRCSARGVLYTKMRGILIRMFLHIFTKQHFYKATFLLPYLG